MGKIQLMSNGGGPHPNQPPPPPPCLRLSPSRKSVSAGWCTTDAALFFSCPKYVFCPYTLLNNFEINNLSSRYHIDDLVE